MVEESLYHQIPVLYSALPAAPLWKQLHLACLSGIVISVSQSRIASFIFFFSRSGCMSSTYGLIGSSTGMEPFPVQRERNGRCLFVRYLGGCTKRFYGGTGRGECGCVDGGVDDSDLLSRNRRCATNEGAGLASVAAGWRVKGLPT